MGDIFQRARQRLQGRKPAEEYAPGHIIYCPPRSGSANLQMVLSSHPQVHNEGEVFNPSVLEEYPANSPIRTLVDPDPEHFFQLLTHLRQSTKKDEVGIKLLYTTLEADERESLLLSGVKIVHLYRSDLLAQALSYAVALRSNVWHLTEESEDLDCSFRIPESELEKNISFIENTFHRTRKLLSRGVTHIEIEYAEFYKSPEIGLRRIQDFLGVERTGLDPDFFRFKTRERFLYHECVENFSLIKRLFGERRLPEPVFSD